MKRSANIPIKAGLSLITVLCALAIIGFLPGTIDGAYSGPESVSDSYNFMLFKDGKLIFYRSEQAPADMSGWYQIERNGKVNVYLTTIELGHTDSIFMRATPRRFFTKFEVVETGEAHWLRKKFMSGRVNEIIKAQEIRQLTRVGSNEVLITHYNSMHDELRDEIKQIETRNAEHAPPAGRGEALRP